MNATNQPFPVDSTSVTTEAAVISADATITSATVLLSESSLDAVWADLEGDLVPEGGADDLGPFAVDSTSTDLWIEYTEISIDIEVTVVEVTYDELAVFMPYEVDAGSTDPFVLPAQDWVSCPAYDPMTAPADWTLDGYVTYDDPFLLDGSDLWLTDAGSYYDTYDPGAGYWDTGSYYDTTSAFLDSPTGYGTWDDLTYAYGDLGGGFDSTGAYDYTSAWDPSAGDAAHEAFLSTITDDYSSAYGDPSDWTSSDSSQFWMDEYNAADDLSWDAWNNSVDAYVAGDDMAAYDWNQQSLDWGSYADDAWSYAGDYSSDYSSDYSMYDY